jgi:hypothetical protein
LEKVQERGITSPGDRCGDFVGGTIVLGTFVPPTVAVPIVMYGLMPRLHQLRVRLLVRRAG